MVGGVLPEAGVTYYDVPQTFGVTPYRYTVVNGQTILVEPRTRRIVQVVEVAQFTIVGRATATGHEAPPGPPPGGAFAERSRCVRRPETCSRSHPIDRRYSRIS